MIERYERVFPNISREPEARFNFTAGRLICRHVREMLEDEVFSGRPIRWREGRGWIERQFTVVGPISHVEQVRERMFHWLRGMGIEPERE